MILKQQHLDGSMVFKDLGDEFILIEKEKSPERFKDAGITFFGNGETHFTGKCQALITHHRGSGFEPLYCGYDYSILYNNGEPLLTLDYLERKPILNRPQTLAELGEELGKVMG